MIWGYFEEAEICLEATWGLGTMDHHLLEACNFHVPSSYGKTSYNSVVILLLLYLLEVTLLLYKALGNNCAVCNYLVYTKIATKTLTHYHKTTNYIN